MCGIRHCLRCGLSDGNISSHTKEERQGLPSHLTSPHLTRWSHQTSGCGNCTIALKSKKRLRRDAQLHNSTRSGPLVSSDQRTSWQNIHRWVYLDVLDNLRCSWNHQTSVLNDSIHAFDVPRNPTVSTLLSKDTFKGKAIIFWLKSLHLLHLHPSFRNLKRSHQSPFKLFLLYCIQDSFWSMKP